MKKKILLVTNGFPFGDSEKSFLSTEYRSLQDEFEVFVLACRPAPHPDEWDGVNRERVFCTDQKRLNPFGVLKALEGKDTREELRRACQKCSPLRLLGRASAVLRYSTRADSLQPTMKEICENNGIDIIYTYWCTQATLAAVRLIDWNERLKVVTRFHGYDLYVERTQELWQPFRFDIAEKSAKLVFVSEKGRDYFITRWGDSLCEKTFVSYLGCKDMQKVVAFDSSQLVIVSCSNVISLKRVHLIAEALGLLSSKLCVCWHHFGDGDAMGELRRCAEQHLTGKMNIQWKLWGKVPNDQLNELYRTVGAQLFVTTSSTEGVPVSLQEAFAAGIPAIATNVGGISELVKDGETGYLLPSKTDSRQVARTIEKYASLPMVEKERMAESARDLWEKKCDAEKNANNLMQMLKNL